MSRHLAFGLAALLAIASCGGPAPTPLPSPSPSPSSAIEGMTGWIAYQGGPGGADEIHLVRTDGTGDRELFADLPGRHRHPDFSPDGTRIAFDVLVSNEAADQLYVAGADGSGPRVVTPCELPDCVSVWEPAWSPDGTRLAVVTAGGPLGRGGPATFGLAIVDVATGSRTDILEHPAADGQDHFPRWSADGTRLVFWRARRTVAGPETAIFVVGTDGSGLRQLTEWGESAGDPDWSPDGNLILYATRPLREFPDEGSSELFVVRPDGTERRQLTSYDDGGERATQPRWTADGTAIIYVHTNQTGLPRLIWSMRADGSLDVPIATEFATYTNPDIAPNPGR